MNLLFGAGLGCTIAIASGSKEYIELSLGTLEVCVGAGAIFIPFTLLYILPIVKFQMGKVLGIYQFVAYVGMLTICLVFSG